MTYLVDANVLSEPTKPMPSEKVVEWLRVNERELVVDSVILGELCIGVLSLSAGRNALEHGLTLATRNVSDFEQSGVKVVDPFADAA